MLFLKEDQLHRKTFGPRSISSNPDAYFRFINIHFFRIRMQHSFLRRPYFGEREELTKKLLNQCIKNNALQCKSEFDNIPIKIILPLSGRTEALEKFLGRFETLIKSSNENIHLVIVNFPQVRYQHFSFSNPLYFCREKAQLNFKTCLQS